jgi:hypothetical protein
MISERIHSRWEKERVENIHDKQAIAEKYGWQRVDLVIEMEIDERKRELEAGRRRDFFNSEKEKKANRFLKKLLSRFNSEARIVQVLRRTP